MTQGPLHLLGCPSEGPQARMQVAAMGWVQPRLRTASGTLEVLFQSVLPSFFPWRPSLGAGGSELSPLPFVQHACTLAQTRWRGVGPKALGRVAAPEGWGSESEPLYPPPTHYSLRWIRDLSMTKETPPGAWSCGGSGSLAGGHEGPSGTDHSGAAPSGMSRSGSPAFDPCHTLQHPEAWTNES